MIEVVSIAARDAGEIEATYAPGDAVLTLACQDGHGTTAGITLDRDSALQLMLTLADFVRNS
jgi:hypothetical protein